MYNDNVLSEKRVLEWRNNNWMTLQEVVGGLPSPSWQGGGSEDVFGFWFWWSAVGKQPWGGGAPPISLACVRDEEQFLRLGTDRYTSRGVVN